MKADYQHGAGRAGRHRGDRSIGRLGLRLLSQGMFLGAAGDRPGAVEAVLMTGTQPGPSPGDGDGQGLSASSMPPPQEPQESPSPGLGPPCESTPSLTPSCQGGCLPQVPPLPSPISLLTAGRVTFLKHHSPLLTRCRHPAVPGESPAPWPEKRSPLKSGVCSFPALFSCLPWASAHPPLVSPFPHGAQFYFSRRSKLGRHLLPEAFPELQSGGLGRVSPPPASWHLPL